MNNKTVSARQLSTFIAVAAMSEGIRVLPGAAASAGQGGAFIALAALPLWLIAAWMLGSLYKKYPNKGLSDICNLSLGRFWGGLTLLAAGIAVPFTVAVFTSRAHSDLFTSAIFPEAAEYRFLTVAVALTFFITRRGLDKAARLTTLFAIALFIALITLFFGSLGSVKAENLLPLWPVDTARFAGSASYCLMVPVFLVAGNLLSGEVHNKRFLRRESMWASGILCAGITLLIVTCVGVLGRGLAARSVSPVFSAAKSLSISGIFERLDAFTVILWIVADITLLLLTGFVFTRVLGGLLNAKQSRLFAAPFAFLTLSAAMALSHGKLAVAAAEAPLLGGGYAAAALGALVLVYLAGMLKKS